MNEKDLPIALVKHPAHLYAAGSPIHGIGVFSSVDIDEDELIEECILIVIPAKDFEILRSTHMFNYCFLIDQRKNKLGLAQGFGSLYNHAAPANAQHIIDKDKNIMTVFATRAIAAGEEICINYNGDAGDESMDWFTARNISYSLG